MKIWSGRKNSDDQTPEEVLIEEERFKAIFILKISYGNIYYGFLIRIK